MISIFKSRKIVVNLSLALFILIPGSGCEKARVPNIISTELNEVKKAIEEVQANVDQKEKELGELQATLDQKEKELELGELRATLDQKEKELELGELLATLDQKERELETVKIQLAEATKEEEVYIIVPQGEIFQRYHGAPPLYGARLDISYKSADGAVGVKSLSYDVCLIVKQSEFASKIQKIEVYTTGSTKYTICDNTAVDSGGDDTALTEADDGSTSGDAVLAGDDPASAEEAAAVASEEDDPASAEEATAVASEEDDPASAEEAAAVASEEDDPASAEEATAVASEEDDPTLCTPAHYTVMSTSGSTNPIHRDIWVVDNIRKDAARYEKYIDITYPTNLNMPEDTDSETLRIVRDKIGNTFKDRDYCLSEVVL